MSKKSFRAAFTLIEVMVAVMIISVVILALIRMYSNNTFLFSAYKKQSQAAQYSSFLIANQEYGFEDKRVTLYDLVNEFDLEDTLRRKLKKEKVEVVYRVMKNIALDEESNTSAPKLSLEIGSSVLRLGNESAALMRLQLR
jgi:prepilin-type N-terminal cleavage/methylation domain-containing protein